MNAHTEILTDEQYAALSTIVEFTKEHQQFLAGGTAVAFHLGHRRSLDFDWFSTHPLDDPMRLAHELTQSGIRFEQESVDRGTLHGRLHTIRCSFSENPYPLLQDTETAVPFGFQIASLADLAAMKLLAVNQRGEKKDFIDIYAMICHGVHLDQMLEFFRQEYRVSDVSRLLYSLTYFEDADSQPMPDVLWPMEWPTVRKEVQKAIQAVVM